MSRDALVVGINTYERLRSLKSPSEDAEAIAQLLSKYGDFTTVKRLPAVKKDGDIHVSQKVKVTPTQLEDALVQLFKPKGEYIPDTALLFFSGHGLRKDRGIQEGYLATSDVNPDENKWGLSLQWLRRLLQESPVRQQIIWLDCCYSGELLNFTEADPGDRGKGRDRCFIAASRAYEEAYEEVSGHHGVLTGGLLQGLDPSRQLDGLATNFTLVDFINQTFKGATQRPIYANSGGQIILTGKRVEFPNPIQGGICPYKGLAYFDCNDQDPKYFYGRTELTDQLLEKVRQGNFLAVLGASGSGKSSVVRAGLLHQLKLGQRLSGSDQWQIHIFRPGEHPLQSLALTFVDAKLAGVDRATQLAKAEELIEAGATGLGHLVAAATASRVVLAVDQFEEVFTLCRDSVERQQFFECLLGAIERTDNKLYLVLVMRADFFGKCAEQEYAGLASKIEQNLVTVKPMNQAELKRAIQEPAKQVGLEIERELVTQMLTDIEGPGSLPLLQYTLTELWQQRTVDRLTLSAYTRLGGVRGTLQKRATEVYQSLSQDEQQTAKRIFLELTQLGEGTEDTRRQVHQQDLVTSQQSAVLVEQVTQKLADAKLVVTGELVEKGPESGRVAVVDIAHEALIRHWPLLRQWIDENRDGLRRKRNIEEEADEWQNHHRSGDYLLQGSRLTDAEDLLQRYADSVSLSTLAQEFVQVSQAERDRLLREKRVRKRWQAGLVIAFSAIIAVFGGLFGLQKQQSEQTIKAVFLSADTTKIQNSLPTFLDEADRLRQEGQTELALAYYRRVRAESVKLLRKVKENSEERLQIEKLSKRAEESLAEVIQAGLLQSLKDDLDNRRWEGARQKTDAILMQDLGAGADLNGSGSIDSPDEAALMPCKTLEDIERLWHQHTQGRCGWYGPDSLYEALQCQELDKETLTTLIFEFPYEEATERIDVCKAEPKSANTDYQVQLLQLANILPTFRLLCRQTSS